MKEYALGLLCVCALSAFVRLATDGGRHSRAATVAMGAVFVYAVVTPLPALVRDVGDGFSDLAGSADYEDMFGEELARSLGEGIRLAVCEEFMLEGEYVSVEVSGVAADPLRAEHIKVKLRGTLTGADHRRIREYVSGMGFGECEVVYDYG